MARKETDLTDLQSKQLKDLAIKHGISERDILRVAFIEYYRSEIFIEALIKKIIKSGV